MLQMTFKTGHVTLYEQIPFLILKESRDLQDSVLTLKNGHV